MSENFKIQKSNSDSKDYRLITLNNGLRVLLISDLKQHDDKNASLTYAHPPSSNAHSSQFGANESGRNERSGTGKVCLEEISCDIKQEDCRKKSSVKVKKKQAAAALCVNVGSFSDPDDIPGLAHFLEHMVFMGSEKYPDENKFDSFIRLHGGSSNAYTGYERTVFQFEIRPDHFAEGLDIWAQFFIAPLLKENSVDREIKPVDAEFNMALNDDVWRIQQLLGTRFPFNHPMRKFLLGNKDSLSKFPSEKGISVYSALKDFHKANYVPHFMTLALQSPENLDTLESWAREIFEHIPCSDRKPPMNGNCVCPNITPFQVVKINPVRNIHELDLTWILPPQQKFYKTKPLYYIYWLIGHEGEGSILAMLRKKHLALSVYCGSSETRYFSLFSINITLTDKGLENYCEVLDIVFQYLVMLQKEGANERIFREIQKIEDIDFMFQEDEHPIENVVDQCENILVYPEEDILTGDYLLSEYNPKCIQNVLAEFSRSNCIIFLSSTAHKELENPMKEPWFGTEFTNESVPDKWIARWSSNSFNGSLHAELHLPAPNQFITEKFDLRSNDADASVNLAKYPVLISKPVLKYDVWYKLDRLFKLPKAYIHFNLINSQSVCSPQDEISLEMLVDILTHNLTEVVYDAAAASLGYSAGVGDMGSLELEFSGFNDKLPLLVDMVADYLVSFETTEEVFQLRLLQHARDYYNILIDPQSLAGSLQHCILLKSEWSVIDKYKACRDLRYTNFVIVVKRFLSSLYIEALIQGNFSAEEANSLVDRFVSKLKCNILTKDDIRNDRVMKLEDSHKVCKVKALNSSDDNSMVSAYFQAGQYEVKKGAMLLLLVTIMAEPCFDILRTKQQLGYSVYVQCSITSGILGLTVNVATQNSKFSVEHTTKKIMHFVTKQMLEIIDNMKDDDFQSQLQSLIAVIRNEDANLGMEVDRNWYEIESRNYVFERTDEEADFLETCTLTDLKEFFMSICIKNNKVLHVQVKGNTVEVNTDETSVANREHATEEKKKDLAWPPHLELEFLCDTEEVFLGDAECTYISNIVKLKNSSCFFPVTDVITK